MEMEIRFSATKQFEAIQFHFYTRAQLLQPIILYMTLTFANALESTISRTSECLWKKEMRARTQSISVSFAHHCLQFYYQQKLDKLVCNLAQIRFSYNNV